MPSVRQVAEEFEMNRATAQLVLGRLESYGFAQAYRGKGFVIRDVRADGGAEVYRRVFQLSLGTPEVAAEMFRDIVAEERGIVLDALVAYTDGAERLHPGELTAAVDELETLARTPSRIIAPCWPWNWIWCDGCSPCSTTVCAGRC